MLLFVCCLFVCLLILLFFFINSVLFWSIWRLFVCFLFVFVFVFFCLFVFVLSFDTLAYHEEQEYETTLLRKCQTAKIWNKKYIICYLPLFPTHASTINTVIMIKTVNADSITTILQALCLYILSSTSPACYPGNKKYQSYITWLIDGISPQICPLVERTSRSFPDSWLITGFVTRVIRRCH